VGKNQRRPKKLLKKAADRQTQGRSAKKACLLFGAGTFIRLQKKGNGGRSPATAREPESKEIQPKKGDRVENLNTVVEKSHPFRVIDVQCRMIGACARRGQGVGMEQTAERTERAGMVLLECTEDENHSKQWSSGLGNSPYV